MRRAFHRSPEAGVMGQPATGLPLWWEGPAGEPGRLEPLPSEVDVAIVGAGFTGLWCAYYLARERPGLTVAVFEARHVGFGASGRNGGWVSALFPREPDAVAARHGATAAHAMVRTLQQTVDEVGEVIAAEGIRGTGFTKGGMIVAARNAAQEARGRAEVEQAQRWDVGTRWLEAAAAQERFGASRTRGATSNPHCARVQPRALVDGLAGAVRRRGGQIHENSPVREASPGRVILADGRRIAAGHIVRATEAYTARLSRLRRRVAPVYSLMVATAPLPAPLWSQIGLARGEVFSDHRHVIIYGQRTADDRIAFGGRGAPYHLGSSIEPRFDVHERVHSLLRATLVDLLPQLEGVEFTHAWGGPLGIHRDWHPSVGYDRNARVGWAGGYVGDGVAASNLAGRTLADLILGRDTPVTRLPWVGHRSPSWEPEPLRWLGINAGLRMAALADREEAVTNRPARTAALLAALSSH